MTGTIHDRRTAYSWLLDPIVQDKPGQALVIATPSGWDDDVTMETPISLEEFYDRLAHCTIIYQDVPSVQSAHEWVKSSIIQNHPRYILDIHDPDGWRHNDGVTMDTPISLQDFLVRFRQCTLLSRSWPDES